MVKQALVWNTALWITEEGYVFNDRECKRPRKCIYDEETGEWFVDLGAIPPIKVATFVYNLFGNWKNGAPVFEKWALIHIDGNNENNHISNLKLPERY
jgi:hypothetical protein